MGGPRSAAGLAAFLLLAVAPVLASDAPEGGPPLRWEERLFRWHYSRVGEPPWLEPGTGLQVFRRAAAAWSACGVQIEFAGESDEPVQRADGANRAGWSVLAPRLRGLTFKRSRAQALVEADVLVNSANSELRTSPELLHKVVMHEFGHALGLVHSRDCGDVMSFGAACLHVPHAALPQRPAPGDLDQCAKRYDPAANR